MELHQLGVNDVNLLEKEKLESALVLRDEPNRDSSAASAVMLLTDKRIIYINRSGKNRRAVFASVRDVEAVEFSVHREGNGAFVWAGLAFIAAFFLFFIIDHSVGRMAAPGIVVILGIYLIIDHFTSPGKQFVVFKTGSSELKADLEVDGASAHVFDFINRLFQLKEKEEDGSDAFSRANRFAPR